MRFIPLSRQLFFCLLLIGIPTRLWAQDPAAELQALLNQLHEFQASFTQTVMEEDDYLLDEQQGILSFERPNRIFWRVTAPYESVLVADGEHIYFHDMDLNQVRVRDWNSSPAENPAAVFVGEGAIADYYKVEGGGQAFMLTPLAEDSNYRSLSLKFEGNRPESMQLRDNLGQTTAIQFAPLGEHEIPGNPYQFDIPVDAEVIVDD